MSDMMFSATSTVSSGQECKHENGWFVWPRFWIFKREYLSCSDCGQLIPRGNWRLS